MKMTEKKTHGNGTTPVKEMDIERTDHYAYRDFESGLKPAKIEFKPQVHNTSDCIYGLKAEDILTQIALYEFDRESYADIIFGNYGGLAENADIIFRAWKDADDLVQICKDFIETVMCQDEEEALIEMNKMKKEWGEADGK